MAPVIVSANIGSTISFGSIASVPYNPWGTLPYLQLPGWSVSAIYAIVGGLFLIYLIGLFSSSIPGVSNITNAIGGKMGLLLVDF